MSTDVLMITHRRPVYTKRSLQRLLDSCDDDSRVWVWHNGDDEATLQCVRAFRDHPRFHRLHHSPVNERLWKPTNWLWENADGDYLAKVDDDCVVDEDWLSTLRSAHEANDDFGVIACWHFRAEDFVPRLARRKIKEFSGGHQLLQNLWVGGSGYLMKRRCIDDIGPLQDGENFSSYCTRLARNGWINGWYFPFVYQDHMDDPRSPHTAIRSDADLRDRKPLGAAARDVLTLEDWERQLQRGARRVQAAPLDPRKARLTYHWHRLWERLRSRFQRR